MLNKISKYSCSIDTKDGAIVYIIKPNETVFQIGKYRYYLNDEEKICFLDNSICYSLFKIDDDFEVVRVNLLNKNQMLFLRKIYKLLNCKFSFTYYNHSITFKDCIGDELMIVNGVINLFDNIVSCNVDLLEKEGVFNDIL